MPTEIEARERWPVQTRAEAFQAGQARYFTGKACKWGHWDQRAVVSGICVACNRNYAAKYRNGAGTDGLVPLQLMAHRDDVETLRMFAAGLQAARDASAQARAFDVDAAHAVIHGPGVVIPADAPKATLR